MGPIEWRRIFRAPSFLVCGLIMLAGGVPAALAAGPLGPPTALPPPCPSPGLLPDGTLIAARETSLASRLLDEILVSQDGVESGRRVAVGSGARDTAVITLPPESFVAGPYGDIVLYGWHTPTTGSEVRAVEMESGCDERLLRPAGVVRSAVLQHDGTSLYVHAVTEDHRRDRGVVRYDLATGVPTQVVDPLPESAVYGPTFTTALAWRADGAELAVQSCGFSRCRTRVLDVASGAVQMLDERPHGQLIGFDRHSLYVWDECHWAPCDVLALERADRRSRVLARDAFGAVLTSDADGARLLVETAQGRHEARP